MFRRSVYLAATTTVLHAVFCSIYLPHTYPELPQPLFTSEQALGAHPIDSIKTKHNVKGKAPHGYTLLFMPEHINVCVIRGNVWQATHQRRQSDN